MYHRILIVEDEGVLRRIIARNLRGRGCEVYEAESAAEAVALAREASPDLLLLDINLPDRSGWDVLRQLRASKIEIPTIILSAVRVTKERLDEFRPLAYLPKPFPLDVLLRLVQGQSHETSPPEHGEHERATGT